MEADNKYILSIVTINRNNAFNLPRTLTSLNKTKQFSEIECIFVDGASIDNSVAIAKEFYNPENILSEPDTGIYHAMNKSLHKASGKYIIWINSGDELDQDLDIKKLLKELCNSELDLLSGQTVMCNPDSGEIIGIFIPKINKLPGHTLPHPSSFFKRSCLMEIGGYDQTLRIVGDRDLIIRMFLLGKSIGVLDVIVAKFYEGGLSYSRAAMFENWRIDKKNGLISLFELNIKIIRFEFGRYRKKFFQ